MLARARKIHIGGETYHWTCGRSGVVLDLGGNGRFSVDLNIRNSDQYCWGGCCLDNLPPSYTPGLAASLAVTLLAGSLKKGDVVDETWDVEAVKKC